MKVLLAFCLVVAGAYCRPEAGYAYPVPGNRLQSGFGSSSSSSSNGYSNGFLDTSSGLSSSGYALSHTTGSAGSGLSSFDYASNGYHAGHDQSYTIVNGKPTVHKHVYVHVAPQEPETVNYRKPIHVPAPQKHYKIVFIKAPTAPTPTAAVLPQIPQNEEKTLIYVLHKSPEEQADIVVPSAVPTVPSKPEVYFIKYKTKKDHSFNSLGGNTGFGSSASSASGSASLSSSSGLGVSGISGSGFDDASLGSIENFGPIDEPTSKYGPPGLIPGKPHH